MLIGYISYILLVAQFLFGSPVNYPIVLAGNFGEPRSNHFHGGIDIKTGGVEGKPIFSIGNGYVSQISIGLFGFGNAVYVHHPEGYTSVYCHLRKFTPQITALLRKKQYEAHAFNGIFTFRPTEFPVVKGQLIAVSGNTGSSQAPHLHLEIHDTRTWNMLDPLSLIDVELQDHTPPTIHAFMVYPQRGEGIFAGHISQTYFGFPTEPLSHPFTAWGKIGFGIWANDYMEETYNHYGIRTTELWVDDSLVFRSDMNNIPVKANRQVNSWGDYHHYLRSHVWYMKSFVEPGCTLPLFETNKERGIINFDEERDYHLTYVVTDVYGNSRRYSLVVAGQKTRISRPAQANQTHPYYVLRYDRMNHFQLPGAMLMVGQRLLGTDVELQPRVRKTVEGYSDSYSFTALSEPLFEDARLSLRVNKAVKDPQKLYLVEHYGPDRYMGGDYHDGWVTGKIRDLGATYELQYDDEPPLINPISPSSWDGSHIISLSVSDKKSGIASYEAYIDGKFVLFELIAKSQWVRCKLTETPVRRTGKEHDLTFVATDNRQNTRTFKTKFKY